MRKSFALSLLLVAAVATNAFAIGEARITGKITDGMTKQPLADATILVNALSGKTFKQEFKPNAKGEYAIFLLDGTLKYKFTYAAPGYTPYIEDMKLKIGAPNVRDIQLTRTDAQTAKVEPAKADPAITAYNEGAALANSGKDAEAVKKFTEAVTAKPDLIAGWEALAKIQLRLKDYAGAIASAGKALAIDADETEMNAVLFEAYNATGDKAKAAEQKKKLPQNPAGLFNDAAKLINSQKDADAEPLLKQAIAADEKFAPAYYELGMLYVRAGKNAEAKKNLEKYIALDPKGKDVATAKEMLNYVK